MISRAVVVPNPPLLIPELVGDAIEETEPLRTSCLLAARRLAQACTDWIAIGTGATTRRLPADRAGTFRGFGVDREVWLSNEDAVDPDPDLPLAALVAGWLREQAGARELRMELLAPDAGAAELTVLAERTSAITHPVGLLVLGDGSNRHGRRAPGYADDRAPGFDDAVADALRNADPKALLALDGGLAAQLGAGGYQAWQALGTIALADGRDWQAELLYSEAPFGVGYHVAVWDPV